MKVGRKNIHLPGRTIWRSPRHFRNVCPPRFRARGQFLPYSPTHKSDFCLVPSSKIMSLVLPLSLSSRRPPSQYNSVLNPPKSLSKTRHHGRGTNSAWNFKRSQWLGDPNCYQSSTSRQDFVWFSGYVLRKLNLCSCWCLVGFSNIFV